jgi:hypothetical protein
MHAAAVRVHLGARVGVVHRHGQARVVRGVELDLNPLVLVELA